MSNKWSNEDIETLKSRYADKKRIAEIASVLGRSEGAITKKAHSITVRKAKGRKREKVYDYAIYRGDEFIFLGTLEECCNFTGMDKEKVRSLCTPSHVKKVDAIENGKALVGVRLEREDEMYD